MKLRIWVILETEDPEDLITYLNETLAEDSNGDKIVNWNGSGELPTKKDFDIPKESGGK